MVEQVTINPEEVRGYGNICEGHTLEDFIVSNSGLAKEKENVHGALTDVYKLVYSLYGLIFSFDKGNKQLYLHSDNDDVVGFSFSEKSLVFNTVSHISFAFDNKNLVVDDEHYLFVDYGVTNNSKLDYWYWNKNYGTGSVSDDGTTFNVTTTSYMTISATLTSPATSSSYIYDFPLTVEFDIVSYGDPTGVTSNSRIRLYNDANNKLAYWDIKDFGVGHYKIVCTEGSQKLYYNGVEQSGSFTFTPTTAWNVAFQTKGHIKYKNFKIWEG